MVELLAGRFDEGVMDQVCRQGTGLFPAPAEIRYRCTCPDGARGSWLCKHVAATLYGVGVRLDDDPEMLFRLRGVAHTELLAGAAAGLTRAREPVAPRAARDRGGPARRRVRHRARGRAGAARPAGDDGAPTRTSPGRQAKGPTWPLIRSGRW